MPHTLTSARLLRDGGIDAMAALNEALREVLTELPDAMHEELKLSVGRAMGEILDATVNPATQAFRELDPSEAEWRTVVLTRAAKRANI